MISALAGSLPVGMRVLGTGLVLIWKRLEGSKVCLRDWLFRAGTDERGPEGAADRSPWSIATAAAGLASL